MDKKKPPRKSQAETAAPPAERLLATPQAAADQIDAILFFLHNRYSGDDVASELPSMRSFLVEKMDIIFTNTVTRIQVEKKPEKNTLNILTPPVPKDDEEHRRIYLLSEFGELLIRSQKEGYQQVQAMLLAILDDDGRETLIREFHRHRKERDVHKRTAKRK